MHRLHSKLFILVFLMLAASQPALARYIEADPINRLGSFNVYGYAEQNPLKFIDPSGLDTVLITAGWPNQSYNIFGHSAMAFTGSGLYSYATGDRYGSSVTNYLGAQLQNRDLTFTIIQTTPDQEEVMKDYFLNNFSQSPLNYSAMHHNCSDATIGAMRSAGLINMNGYPTLPFDAESVAQSIPNSQTYTLPKGSPLPVEYFNPYNKAQ